MALTQTTTPTDPIKSIGDDATATFENDPKFIEPTPGSEGSSDNVEEQQSAAWLARDTDDLVDSDEDEEEDDDLEDDDDEYEDDEEDEVDEDEEFDDTDEDDEDDDEDEEEDDEDEVAAAPLRADGLLGYEDEAEDVEKGRSEEQGGAFRERAEAKLKQPGSARGTRATATDDDDDAGDVDMGVSEDAFTEDDMDTDRIAALPAMMAVLSQHAAAMSHPAI